MGTTPDEQYDADDKEPAQATRPDAIRLDPGNAVYHDDLGRALYEQERYEEAEAAQREAVRLNPITVLPEYCRYSRECRGR